MDEVEQLDYGSGETNGTCMLQKVSAIGKTHAQIILKTNSHLYDSNIPASRGQATVNERTTVREYLNVAIVIS